MKKVVATVYADTGDGSSPDDFEVMCAIRKFIVDGLESTGDSKRHAVRLAEAYMGNRAQEQPGSIEDAVVETISKLKECGAFDKGDC